MGFHEVNFMDLGLSRVRRLCASGIGEPVHRWWYYGMPRVHPQLQDCVFFLFRRNPESGEIDEGPLGSGFFISRSPGAKPGLNHLYAVSNWHLAIELGASIIRLNTKGGKTRFLEYDPMDWTFSREDDLAIVDVHDDLRPGDDIAHFNERDFLAGERWSRAGLTIGEDAFMIGLFTSHHGGDWNTPCARFGNIAMLAHALNPVEMWTGFERPCHLIDTHSRGGFSGSPVFAYRTSGADLSYIPRQGETLGPRPQTLGPMLALLGIHCGQFWEEIEFKKATTDAEATNQPILEGDKLKVPSSMTIVMPAWRISTLLDAEDLAMVRKKREEGWRRDRENKIPRPESASLKPSPRPTDANPTHQEDFNSLVSAAARKREQED
jgi:hypothetical protein